MPSHITLQNKSISSTSCYFLSSLSESYFKILLYKINDKIKKKEFSKKGALSNITVPTANNSIEKENNICNLDHAHVLIRT